MLTVNDLIIAFGKIEPRYIEEADSLTMPRKNHFWIMVAASVFIMLSILFAIEKQYFPYFVSDSVIAFSSLLLYNSIIISSFIMFFSPFFGECNRLPSNCIV